MSSIRDNSEYKYIRISRAWSKQHKFKEDKCTAHMYDISTLTGVPLTGKHHLVMRKKHHEQIQQN